MKIKYKVLFILLATLFVFTTASAYSGITGTIQDAYGDPWKYECWVYAYRKGVGTTYIPISTPCNIDPIDGSFEIPFTTIPNNNDWVVVVIDFGSGGEGIPSPYATEFKQDTSQSGDFDLGVINTNTGPNAIVLQDLTAASPGANPWLAAFIVVGALALVSGGMVALRKGKK